MAVKMIASSLMVAIFSRRVHQRLLFLVDEFINVVVISGR